MTLARLEEIATNLCDPEEVSTSEEIAAIVLTIRTLLGKIHDHQECPAALDVPAEVRQLIREIG